MCYIMSWGALVYMVIKKRHDLSWCSQGSRGAGHAVKSNQAKNKHRMDVNLMRKERTV